MVRTRNAPIRETPVATAKCPVNDDIDYEGSADHTVYIDGKLHVCFNYDKVYLDAKEANWTTEADEKTLVPHFDKRVPFIRTLKEMAASSTKKRLARKRGKQKLMCPYCLRQGWIGRRFEAQRHMYGHISPDFRAPCPVFIQKHKLAQDNGEDFVFLTPQLAPL